MKLGLGPRTGRYGRPCALLGTRRVTRASPTFTNAVQTCGVAQVEID